MWLYAISGRTLTEDLYFEFLCDAGHIVSGNAGVVASIRQSHSCHRNPALVRRDLDARAIQQRTAITHPPNDGRWISDSHQGTLYGTSLAHQPVEVRHKVGIVYSWRNWKGGKTRVLKTFTLFKYFKYLLHVREHEIQASSNVAITNLVEEEVSFLIRQLANSSYDPDCYQCSWTAWFISGR